MREDATANAMIAHGPAAADNVRVRTDNAIYYLSRIRLNGQTHKATEQQMAADERLNRHTHNHQPTTHNLQAQSRGGLDRCPPKLMISIPFLTNALSTNR